jgi:hypothetical protein
LPDRQFGRIWPDRLHVNTPIYLHCIRRRSRTRTRLRFCRCVCKRPKGHWIVCQNQQNRQSFCRKRARLVAKLSKLNMRKLHGNVKYKIQNGKPFIHYMLIIPETD